MSDQTANKADIEKVRDLFGLSHDLIAQAQFPGHVSPKVAEAMNFLAFQYQDFKRRAEAVAAPATEAAKAPEVALDAPKA